MKFLEENIGEVLHDLGFGNGFFKYDTKSTNYQRKNRQIELPQN